MDFPFFDHQTFHPLYLWIRSTPISWVMNNIPWAWPLCESMHFIGLSMLVGTVGFFDLRLLGFARRVPIAALHRLIPIGVAGFAINAAFQVKVAFFLIAGVNVAVFYLTMFRSIREVGPGQQAPLVARLIGGVSLCSWIGVMTAGRLLTFYRPLF